MLAAAAATVVADKTFPSLSQKLITFCIDFTKAGASKRVPKRVTDTVAICKVTVSWPTYWLSDITR